jgi:transcriptional regulator with XRE-family HTH domain
MPRVNPEILSWARKTAGFSQSDAVEKLGINDARGVAAVDRLAAIESGAKEPSRPFLLKMARHYRRGLPTLRYFVSASEHYGVSWCGGAMVGVESGSGTGAAKIL